MFPEPAFLREGRLRRLRQLVRFYQAAIINTIFGFGSYALLVWLGVDRFLAQIIAQALGMVFNYFTYSRHVFHGSRGAKARFVVAYGVNYFVNLGLLAYLSMFIHSPYVAGLCSTVCASLINYFALKYVVFNRRASS